MKRLLTAAALGLLVMPSWALGPSPLAQLGRGGEVLSLRGTLMSPEGPAATAHHVLLDDKGKRWVLGCIPAQILASHAGQVVEVRGSRQASPAVADVVRVCVHQLAVPPVPGAKPAGREGAGPLNPETGQPLFPGMGRSGRP